MDYTRFYEDISKVFDTKVIPNLMEYIKIPNKSPNFDPLWEENGFIMQACLHAIDWAKANAPKGMQLELITEPGRPPLIYIDIPGEIKETVLLYGHLDKQPEMEGWRKGLAPWLPVLEKNRLYGRGAADDGYAIYSSLVAISALQDANIPHPRCVLLIESGEESGSRDLPHYLSKLKERIGNPALVIGLDSGAGNYSQFWMTTSLRGLITVELTAELITEGVHSGNAGGIVPDSFHVLRNLLSRLEDEKTARIIDPGFYCSIPAERLEQARAAYQTLQDEVVNAFPWHEGVKPLDQDGVELILNRTWRPALAVIGAEGLPPTRDAGSVIRPKTTLKLSLRLPPLVDPESATALLVKLLTENPPYQAKIHCEVIDKIKGWHAPLLKPWLKEAVDQASKIFYQAEPAYMGEGGSIPFMAILGENFPAADFVITGVLGPHSNAHGPNEFLEIDMAKKLTASIAYILSKVKS